MRECLVFRVPCAAPDDVSGLERLLAEGRLQATQIRAILGKTEGNGCVNDYTRAFAVQALQALLAGPLGLRPAEVGKRIALVMSGGTEGGLAPHFLIFAVAETAAPAAAGKALAMGTAFTPDFRPGEIGRMAQLRATATAVEAAMRDAGIESTADVHYVQVKCPLLTSAAMVAARAAGEPPVTDDTYASMGYSRGASALGVALALGEIDPSALYEEVICTRRDLFSARASTSAGVETACNQVMVLGNSAAWGGASMIAHDVMQDAIDLPAVQRVLGALGLPAQGQLDARHRDLVQAVLAKADPSSDGRIRGARHIMLEDSDINATRHARALVGGVIAAAIGRTELFVSGGAEHQGPDGGGPVAIIARRA